MSLATHALSGVMCLQTSNSAQDRANVLRLLLSELVFMSDLSDPDLGVSPTIPSGYVCAALRCSLASCPKRPHCFLHIYFLSACHIL